MTGADLVCATRHNHGWLARSIGGRRHRPEFLDEQGGILGIGPEAEATFGHRHFMELLAVFTSPPVISVRHGRAEIGHVPDEALLARPPGAQAGGPSVLTLAGRSWHVLHVDWPRRIAHVEPTDAPGVARWTGGGQPLGAHVARGIRAVLTGDEPDGINLSTRATERLAQARADNWWTKPNATTIVTEPNGKTLWWTFAGWKANLWLAAIATTAGVRTGVTYLDDLAIALDPSAEPSALHSALAEASTDAMVLAPWIIAEAIDGLKFSECLPRDRASEVVAARLTDGAAVSAVKGEPLVSARLA
jgi:ATP-dependent Lhr-like helicase